MLALQKLYYARTSSTGLFRSAEGREAASGSKLYLEDEEGKLLKATNLQADQRSSNILAALKNEVLKHRTIRLDFNHWLDLLIGCSSYKKLNRLYAKGTARLAADLNVVRIVKKLRHLDVIAENSTLLKSKERKFQVAHTYQNLIDLDSLGSEEARQEKNTHQEQDYEGGDTESLTLPEAARSQ